MIDANKIVSLLKNSKPLSFIEIAKKLNVQRHLNKDFSAMLFKLEKENRIFKTKKRDFYIPDFIGESEGEIRLNPRGFGFIDLEDISIFIAPSSKGGAMNNDVVVVKYFKDISGEGYQGVITKVIKRNKTNFVGEVKMFHGNFGIVPNDPTVSGIFRFVDTSGIKEKNLVKVEIIEFGKICKVKVLKVLGDKDDVSIDILSSIEDANILTDFNPETIAQTKTVPDSVLESEIKGREDLRNRMIVTIDGDDTKDFDDAIEVSKLANGNFMLGVHIADVTHYVKEKTALDDEAKARGTSVYLADRVIPMLPRALSNGICSLNPNVDRLVLSCEMEINNKGETVSTKIYEGVINSKHRLTYKDVNDFYANTKSFEDEKLTSMLKTSKELSEVIRKFKLTEGYIDFEIDESKLIIDDLGKTTDIVVRDRGESEMLIEDFMVRANETVAKYIFDKELPFIYRVHDKPDEDRLLTLQNILNVLGMKIQVPLSADPKDFSRVVNQIKETRFDDFMKILMLRTMSKAIYSDKNIGHFGLASETYTHFTSPIRRYPDLMVHRMLREYIFNGNKKKAEHFAEILPGISAHSSECEQTAVNLERKVADIKKAEYYEQFIGQEFEGQIVSIMKFGFFVEFP
ncbi:MAG: ribonuclease R, partial [Mycoplasmataceae bacterium]|nr:ribonuclease R [Mycoplasmataceae bacterium]